MNIDSDEAQTKPTMNTLLERINTLGDDLTGQINSMRDDLTRQIGTVDGKVDSLGDEFQIRLDRIEGMTNQTRAEMLNLRADFREWRGQLKESLA